MKRSNFYRSSIAVLVVLFVFLIGPTANAQQPARNYFAIKYIKVDPANESEFLRAQLEVWKKVHTKRISEGGLDGWYFMRVVSPAGTATDYNYLTIEMYDSAEKVAGHFNGYGINYRGILGADEIALALRTPLISNMRYEEVWRTVDQILSLDAGQMYRYQVFNSMKLRPGVDDAEYQRMESDYWKPMHEKRMKLGNMNGWGIYTMIFPGGTEREYHWGTVDFFDNFIDILKPTDGIMESIHGQKNAEKFTEETISKRDLLKAEIRELIDYAAPSN